MEPSLIKRGYPWIIIGAYLLAPLIASSLAGASEIESLRNGDVLPSGEVESGEYRRVGRAIVKRLQKEISEHRTPSESMEINWVKDAELLHFFDPKFLQAIKVAGFQNRFQLGTGSHGSVNSVSFHGTGCPGPVQDHSGLAQLHRQ